MRQKAAPGGKPFRNFPHQPGATGGFVERSAAADTAGNPEGVVVLKILPDTRERESDGNRQLQQMIRIADPGYLEDVW